MNFAIKPHTVVIMIGPSCCGKSTFIEEKIKEIKIQFPKLKTKTISSDDNRRYFLCDDTLHKYNKNMMRVSAQAFKLMHEQLKLCTSWPVNNEIVFVDATNLSSESRNEFITIADDNNYEVAFIVFKYKNRKDYFGYSDNNSIVTKHIDRFYTRTIRELGQHKNQKFYVTDRNFSNYSIEVKFYEEYISNFIDHENVAVVGDIHGQNEALKHALEWCDSNALIPVLVGDILDKEEDIEKIQDCINIITMRIAKNKPLLLVNSNHDYAAMSFLNNENKYKDSVMLEFFPTVFQLTEENKTAFKFIMSHAKSFLRHDRFIITHSPCKSKYLGKIFTHSMKMQRGIRYPKRGESTHEEWSKECNEFINKTEYNEFNAPYHVFGHMAFQAPYLSKSSIGIDTGAAYNNCLTVVDLSRNYPKFKSFGNGFKLNENLIKQIQEIKEIDLIALQPRERGRIFWSAKEGLPVTSGTMCPANKLDKNLESLEWALNYYKEPVMQIKYMGSWSCVRLRKRVEECKTFSRNGYLVKKDGLESAYQELIDKANWNGISEYILGAELMPWRFLGDDLIDKDFYGMQWLIQNKLNWLANSKFLEQLNKIRNLYENVEFNKKKIIEERGHHIWKTLSAYDKVMKENFNLEDLKIENEKFLEQIELYGNDCQPYFKPFVIFKVICETKEEILANDNLAVFGSFNTDPCYIVDKSRTNWLENSIKFFNTITTRKGYEGVVVKPKIYEEGKAPYLKVRNREYLRLTYGYDYQLHEEFHSKRKHINRKLKASITDWNRALKLLKIPVNEISEDNKEYINLIADFVVEDRHQQTLDPRL